MKPHGMYIVIFYATKITFTVEAVMQWGLKGDKFKCFMYLSKVIQPCKVHANPGLHISITNEL